MPPIADYSDLRQSPDWARYMESLGWLTEKVDGGQFYVKKFPFGLGSIVKILRSPFPTRFSLEKIDQLAKKHRAWFVKLEPRATVQDEQLVIDDFQKHGFYPSSWPLSPSKTILIDLEKTKTELRSGFKKETRYVIRKAETNNVLVSQSKEIEHFCDLWVKSMRKKGNLFVSGGEMKKIRKAFGENGYLLFAHRSTDQTQPLAGLLMLVYDRVGYYFAAASTNEGNQLGAPSLLVYRAILLAKKQGGEIFDFDGVYDPRYHRATKSWQGFTRFKKGFGGKEVDLVGSFIKGYGRPARFFRFLISNC